MATSMVVYTHICAMQSRYVWGEPASVGLAQARPNNMQK